MYFRSSRDMFQEDGIIALASIDLLIPIAMNFLKCDYDDVSQSCFEFCRGYLQICKVCFYKFHTFYIFTLILLFSDTYIKKSVYS